MLNFKSFHQPKHKINVANNFIHRVCSLTRNKSKAEIASTIHQHLRRNNYPKQLINRLLNRYINKRQEVSSVTLDRPQLLDTIQNHPPYRPPDAPPNHSWNQQPPTPPPLQAATINPVECTRSQPSCQPPTQLAIEPAVPIPHTQPAPLLHHPSGRSNIDHHEQQTEPATIDHHITRRSINDTNEQNNIQPMPEQPAIDNEKVYRAIPYVPALSQRITKMLAKDYPHISITTKQHRTINDLHTKVKYPVSKEEISNVIYKIPCNNCDKCYVGMTRNNLRKRLAGHKSNVNKLEKLLNDDHTNTEAATATLIDTTTALIQHCIENDHRFNLDRTQVIDHSYKSSTLPFLEMCHITNTNNTVNKRTDVDRLSTTYAAVLHSIKNRNERNTSRREQQTADESTDESRLFR